jgi:hypothetical protein
MDSVRVYYDLTGNTLTVWFDAPTKERFSEEIEDDTVIMKDRRGRVIGFERLSYFSRRQLQSKTKLPVDVKLLWHG